jgi:1-pyrroline-5-carboxylate dehydrogenase
MTHGNFQAPLPLNEPVRAYGPGSPEKLRIKAELARQSGEVIEIPLVIDGEEVRTGKTEVVSMPHNHRHRLAVVHLAGPKEVARACEAATRARNDWERLPWQERAAVILRAGELLTTTWRDRINASTMLGQSKTVHQAEIDSACEAIDFLRFNAHFAARSYSEQPQSSPGVWNRLEHRPLDGFVFAITPFNFTSIAINLCTAPVLMGNTCVWKPATTAVYSNWYSMKLLEAAGMPRGVINFVPGPGPLVGDAVLADKRMAGVHFTGSTGTFNSIWNTVAKNLGHYGQYPRLVGETGGKDFIFAHPSADVQSLCVAMLRGAYEYQGQKCSAASRAYIPKSLWKDVQARLSAMFAQIKMGDVADFSNYVGAVIDKKSFAKQKSAIAAAKQSADAKIIFGGKCDDSVGWFVEPTLIEAKHPDYDTMCTELFGPVLTVHVYADNKFEQTLERAANGSEYALTGAVFCEDRLALTPMIDALRFAAGNFYVNDKPTGAVVGQQPFGGSRMSGTNDKAGSILNLTRWVSPRTIKETFVPAQDWRYSFLDEA